MSHLSTFYIVKFKEDWDVHQNNKYQTFGDRKGEKKKEKKEDSYETWHYSSLPFMHTFVSASVFSCRNMLPEGYSLGT